ncbi:twin-arginine translocation signal domain-containing protein [Streptomyces sp. me109]|nr:twin-arginine translocation signal domain-containing protein [Streptomyces sp. me109]
MGQPSPRVSRRGFVGGAAAVAAGAALTGVAAPRRGHSPADTEAIRLGIRRPMAPRRVSADIHQPAHARRRNT